MCFYANVRMMPSRKKAKSTTVPASTVVLRPSARIVAQVTAEGYCSTGTGISSRTCRTRSNSVSTLRASSPA